MKRLYWQMPKDIYGKKYLIQFQKKGAGQQYFMEEVNRRVKAKQMEDRRK